MKNTIFLLLNCLIKYLMKLRKVLISSYQKQQKKITEIVAYDSLIIPIYRFLSIPINFIVRGYEEKSTNTNTMRIPR